MPPKKAAVTFEDPSKSKKRKDSPKSIFSGQKTGNGGRVKRVKTHDARSILTQTTDAALSNGELDLQSFLKSREFEIKALQDGMQRAKGARTTRAFQQVPRDMRRRTASHNVKRVPSRLQSRAKREMKDDNTPTVDPSKRKPGTSRGRVRAETAKRLGILAAKKRALKDKAIDAKGIATRAARPKIRKNILNGPQKPKSKFRKRQIHKTWLPTHVWHAKRAKMTEPKKPLWRFAIPLTSTEKSYRPTHRAGGARGAVVWDMSYMSTIGLRGAPESLGKVLKAMGVTEEGLWENRGEKWRSGKRSWSGWLSRESKTQRIQVAPATIFWCASEPLQQTDVARKKKLLRQLFIRMHPAAFLETWNEVLRIAKLQRPTVDCEDLRFEVGSMEITGPGSTEALIGTLHPYEQTEESHGQTFKSLAGVTNPASLPVNALLAFSVIDPRLRYPPRPAVIPKPTDEAGNFALLQTISAWPADASSPSTGLFDRDSRFKATRLPSQKSLNRRKSQAPPGSYPSVLPTDPLIPIMLLTSRTTPAASAQGTWTLLAPWKCILPIWYSLLHYPLSSGGNPRFGGIDEIRQIHFEHGLPWFPADYPGTNSGFAWETEERQRRKAEWERRPKGKRVEWDSVDLGAGRKGEIGQGWACDFERLLLTPPPASAQSEETTQDTQVTSEVQAQNTELPIYHLNAKAFTSLLSSTNVDLPPPSTVASVRITLVSRGIATPCARVYRLPTPSQSTKSSETTEPETTRRDNENSVDSAPRRSPKTIEPPPTLREQWLPLIPSAFKTKPPPNPKSKSAKRVTRIPLDIPLPQRIRLLAQSLLDAPPLSYPADNNADGHPLVPDEEDLIGFVTTGEFNLAEGKGVAMGSVFVAKAIKGLRRESKEDVKYGRWCIVRNSGETIGRLARWEPV